MKAFRPGRWGSTVLAPGNKLSFSPLILPRLPHHLYSLRFKHTRGPRPEQHGYGPLPAKVQRGKPKTGHGQRRMGREPPRLPPSIPELKPKRPKKVDVSKETFKKETLPSPPINTPSAKLSALYARLSLSQNIPLQTLARCLVDNTADPDIRFNNVNLSAIGNDILGYYIAEHLVCHYPRLPMVVLTAAMHGYVGRESLASVAEGWGVEVAAEPGGEVDPGLLQFHRTAPNKRLKEEVVEEMEQFSKTRMQQQQKLLVKQSWSGKKQLTAVKDVKDVKVPPPKTVQEALHLFVRAVFGAIYLHCGARLTKEFFDAHILSRHLDIASLFTFSQPTRDLSRLCAREGFEPPVARLISETGRQSRHPVFVVGVFSGRDKIGEDAGASLNEARFKAAAKALKGWYLYSPKNSGSQVMVPSEMMGTSGQDKTWVPAYIDDGEIVA